MLQTFKGTLLMTLICFAATTAWAATDIHFLPLEKGNRWIFSGPVTWTPGADGPKTATISWTMEILDVTRRDDITAARVRGFPGETAMYDPSEPPGESLIVQVGPSWYYHVSGTDRVASISRRLADPEDGLHDLISDLDLWLTAPLTVGSRYGETTQITRTDRSYCWEVAEEQTVSLQSYLPTRTGSAKQYRITTQARNGRQELMFVPGVGLVGYQSVHHGTPFESRLTLVECHLKGAPAATPEVRVPAEPVSTSVSLTTLSLEEALQLGLEHVRKSGVDLSAQHLGSVTRQFDAQLKKPCWHLQWQWNLPRMGGEFGLAVFMDRSVVERRCGP